VAEPLGGPARCEGLQPSLLTPHAEGRAAKHFDEPKTQATAVQAAGSRSPRWRRQANAAPQETPHPYRPHRERRRDSARRRPSVPQASRAGSFHWRYECRVRKRPTQGHQRRAGAGPMPAQSPVLGGQVHTRARNQIRAATPYASPYARYTPTNPNSLKPNHESEAKQISFFRAERCARSWPPRSLITSYISRSVPCFARTNTEARRLPAVMKMATLL